MNELNRLLFLYTGFKIRIKFWRKLARLLENGVNIQTSLEFIRDIQIKTMGANDALALGIKHWLMQLRKGNTLSQSVKGWVSDVEIMLINAGERSGNLPKNIDTLITVLLSQKKMKASIIAGLSYPSLLMMLTIGLVSMFGYMIVPAFNNAIGGREELWTGMARYLTIVAAFVQDYLLLMIVMLVLAIFLFAFSLPRWDGKIRVWLDSRFPYSIYKSIQGANWMLSMSALVSAGIMIEECLQILRRDTKNWLHNRISTYIRLLKKGRTIGEALAESGYRFPDDESIGDLCIYGQQGSFDEALSIIGRETVIEGEERMKVLMARVFSLSLIFIGLSLMFFLGGMFDMQIQIQSIIKR